MKKNIKYIIILTSCIVLYIVVELTAPKQVDWSMSFSKNDKIPYGNYILYKLLPGLFTGKDISVMHDTVYDALKEGAIKGINYIFINNTIDFDIYDTKELLRFVSKGNHVFIAARHFLGEFADTFGIRTSPGKFYTEKMGINFINRYLRSRRDYTYKKNTANNYFSFFKKERAVVLGINDNRKANFIKVKYGKGAFYLSCLPFAFTNYNMLCNTNSEYIFKSLSYLPIQNTFWDEYYKTARIAPRTPLRYILSREPLKWAYYVSVLSLILFIVFKARREQRIIPKIDPLPNATLEFIETVGRLYYEKGDHKNIAEKKIIYFFEYILSRFYVDAFHITHNFYKQLSAKAGVTEHQVKDLFDYINYIQKRKKISDDEIIKLNRMIEEFNNFII